MQDIDFSQYLRLVEAAKLCGVSHSSLSKLVKRGDGPPSLVIGSTRFFHRAGVLAWKKYYEATIKRRKPKV